MEKVLKKALEVAKKVAITMHKECDGSYVGAEEDHIFTLDGEKYEVTIIAFWEKVRHFDVSITGVDNDFKKHQNCVEY